MAKSLSERIAERVQARKLSKTGKNRAVFLALRSDIKQALDDGWPIKTIWETLYQEGKIAFGYDAFIGYVNRLIRFCEQAQASVPPPVPVAKEPSGKKPAPPPKISGFKFESAPKKEDLL